jgi:hypothetical protein
MAAVTVFVRLRPDVARANNTPGAVRQRFRDALDAKPAAGPPSFPDATGDVGFGEAERPLEDGVATDGPPVDIRFDWADQEGADAFLHSEEWLTLTGPVTRAPFYAVFPK